MVGLKNSSRHEVNVIYERNISWCCVAYKFSNVSNYIIIVGAA